MGQPVRTRVVVEGRVQGVWFRDSTRAEAQKLGLAGWVRNLPDGRVEAVFEGPSDAVAAACAWCRKGPSHAVVIDVTTVDEQPVGLTGFEIRR